MSIKLTKRTAATLLGRGITSVRIKPDALEDAKKAITREDVRALIKSGRVYALKEKNNLSVYSKVLKEKRDKGRRRGKGKKKGTKKARGMVTYQKKVRAQRRLLAELKKEKAINNEMYKKFYALVKGGSFQTKMTLINHIKSRGVSMTDEQVEKLKHI
ncbi:Ribosomal protein L19/L19e [mine drainage metagenome]|uniref:Ribosomal protein L19/L19e n=1 Tax=mine drainage metagenome TaxID=410659 RepID=T1CGV0_9ZZZZ